MKKQLQLLLASFDSHGSSKHAQLTLMIITGIVLLFAVGLVIWLGTTTSERRIAPEVEQQRLRQIAVQPVKDYIQSCLDVVTSTAVELLGKQGGVLYQSQGGLTADVHPSELGSRYVEFDGLNVSYVILRPTQDIGMMSVAQPPDYPYSTFPYIFRNNDPNTRDVVKVQYEGYFGESRLPPLLKPGRESIQEQLESYIMVNMPRCADWKTFKDVHGLEITANEPNASVFIAKNLTQIETEQFFTVTLGWPVLVKDLTTQRETALREFSLSYPVHMAKFYLFVQSLVIKDISNATFDPRSASTQATPVIVQENVFTNPDDKGSDSIVVVQDAAAQLRGRPLEFRVLRKNRFPALVWVNQTELNDYVFIPAKMCDISQDNVVLESSTLHIRLASSPSGKNDWQTTLQAIDPDENRVTFHTKAEAPFRFPGPSIPYELTVYVSDGGDVQDSQILTVNQGNCPEA